MEKSQWDPGESWMEHSWEVSQRDEQKSVVTGKKKRGRFWLPRFFFLGRVMPEVKMRLEVVKGKRC